MCSRLIYNPPIITNAIISFVKDSLESHKRYLNFLIYSIVGSEVTNTFLSVYVI